MKNDEHIRLGQETPKKRPKVSPLKGKKLASVKGITGKAMRVPLTEVEVTHPVKGFNAFWYKGKRVVLTSEQEQFVLKKQRKKVRNTSNK